MRQIQKSPLAHLLYILYFKEIVIVFTQCLLRLPKYISNLQIQQTAPAESISDGIVLPVQLSWSHYERLIRVANPEARMWYMQEAATQQWDYRTLKRNIDSQYYYRLNQTPEVKRQEVVDEMHHLTADYEKAIIRLSVSFCVLRQMLMWHVSQHLLLTNKCMPQSTLPICLLKRYWPVR